MRLKLKSGSVPPGLNRKCMNSLWKRSSIHQNIIWITGELQSNIPKQPENGGLKGKTWIVLEIQSLITPMERRELTHMKFLKQH